MRESYQLPAFGFQQQSCDGSNWKPEAGSRKLLANSDSYQLLGGPGRRFGIEFEHVFTSGERGEGNLGVVLAAR